MLQIVLGWRRRVGSVAVPFHFASRRLEESGKTIYPKMACFTSRSVVRNAIRHEISVVVCISTQNGLVATFRL